MNRAFSILTAAALLIAMTASSAACSGWSTIRSSDVEPKVEQMLEYISSGDSNSAFSMMYPGETEKDVFDENFNAVRKTFIIPKTYSLTMRSFRSNTGTGFNGVIKVLSGEYLIGSGSQRFRLTVEWKEADSLEGFTSFNIINEIDLARTGED